LQRRGLRELRKLVCTIGRLPIIEKPIRELSRYLLQESKAFDGGTICYDDAVTKDRMKAILDRVLTWPPERQADVACVVQIMEEQDRSALRLSDVQAEAVGRRFASPSTETFPAEDLFRRYRSTRA
jgi:hypothetical protein